MFKVASQPWVDHRLYNTFPTVEEARELASNSEQIRIAGVIADSIPELIRNAGITITHSHWRNQPNQKIVGFLQSEGTLLSKPYEIGEADVWPTTWVAKKDELLATEGIDNPSLEVRKVVGKVQEFAKDILPLLATKPDEEYSRFSIAVDPRKILNTNAKHFVETSCDGASILTPLAEEEQFKSSDENAIPTYLSIESPQADPVTVGCVVVCWGSDGHTRSHARF